MSTAKKSALGPLSNLLTQGVQQFADSQQITGSEKPKQLSVDQLQRGQYQPRQTINDASIAELAESIRSQGIIQPIIVRQLTTGKYEIIAGERRWRAAQEAGLKEVPVVIRQLTDQDAIAMALIENIQREDLNPLESALSMQRLQLEFNLTHQEMATLLGKSRVTITNLLRLLQLNDDVKKLLQDGVIEMGHARALLSLEGHAQSQAAEKIIAGELTVREAEKLIQNWNQVATAKTTKSIDPDVKRLQQTLSDKLGAPVIIQHNPKNGKGKVIIRYHNLDELDGVLTHIH